MNIHQEIDLTNSLVEDLTAEFGRTLIADISTSGMTNQTGGTLQLSGYTGATLLVYDQRNTVVMTFSTEDDSIILNTNSIEFNKSWQEMSIVRRGIYQYSMYLDGEIQHYGFLRGKFKII